MRHRVALTFDNLTIGRGVASLPQYWFDHPKAGPPVPIALGPYDDNASHLVGGVTFGGDFCLDLVRDGDAEVWAGPLAGNKWAVALLNRNPSANATITANWTMFNASAGASFAAVNG